MISKQKKILASVLAVVLVALAIFAVIMLTKKKDDTTTTDLDKSIKVIQTVTARNDEIIDNYSKIHATSAVSGNVNALNASAATTAQLEDYAVLLENNFILPYFTEFLINSTKSNIYQNSFELNKTYYATESTLVVYSAVRISGNKVYLQMAMDDSSTGIGGGIRKASYYSTINYDFETDKLLSADTFCYVDQDFLTANIDYATNTCQSLLLSNMSEENFAQLKNGTFDYDKYTITETSAVGDYVMSANITDNANNVIITSYPVTKDSPSVKAMFNEIIRSTNVSNFPEILDKNKAVINTAVIDARDYASIKGWIQVAEEGGKRSFYSRYVDYNTAKAFFTALLATSETGTETENAVYSKHLNTITSRGEAAYTGYEYGYEIDGTNYRITLSQAGNKLLQLNIYSNGDSKTQNYKFENGQLTAVPME